MIPISFLEHNITLYGEESEPLPAFTDGKSIVSCWQPTDEEMAYIKARIEKGEKPAFYLDVQSQTHPPVFIGAGSESVFEYEKPKKVDDKEIMRNALGRNGGV